ncbi:transposase family protein [Streptomyces sp. NPDC001275]
MLELVFPHLVTVLVEHVMVESGVLRITASTKDRTVAVCPGCGSASTRVHSRYGRTIADAPVGARPVVIELSVRRLFCDNGDCARMTFAEQVDGLTSRYGRRTPVLQRIVGALGVVLAARAVARLGLLLGIVVSRMTVLRVVMALPEPTWEVPRVLGPHGRPTAAQDAAGPFTRTHSRHQPRPDVRDHHEQPRPARRWWTGTAAGAEPPDTIKITIYGRRTKWSAL